MNEKVNELLNNTLLDAHKGDSFKYAENSLEAILSAFKNPFADAVEFDIRMTKDGKLVVRHDDMLLSTTNSFKKISEMTLDELKDIKVSAHKVDYYMHVMQNLKDHETNYGMEKLNLLKNLITQKNNIITLEELLKQAPNDKKLLLEVKGNDEYYKSDKYSKAIAEMVNNYQNKKIQIHGFDSKMMLWFKEHTNALIGIGIRDDLGPLDLELDHACFNLSKVNNQLPIIIDALEKRPTREFHFWKVDTTKELELYELFLRGMAERGLNSQTSIMTNDTSSTRYMIEDRILNERKVGK